MSRPASLTLTPPEVVLTVVTAAVGAFNAGATVHDSGSTSGVLWMTVFALVGLIGLALVALGKRAEGRRTVAAGLLLTALAPTVFAYPLNVALLVCAAWEFLADRQQRHRRAVTA